MASHNAADIFVTACAAGEPMPFALDRLARSVGAEGATLVRSIGDTTLELAASDVIADAVRSYAQGDRPPDPREARVLPRLAEGFRTDLDDFTADEIARDPFYQEFLAPRGLGWHACALLTEGGAGEQIHLSFKRRHALGPFQPDDLAPLTAQLPLLRATAAFSRRLVADNHGDARLLTRDGRALYALDAAGHAALVQGNAQADGLLGIVRGRMKARSRRDQAAIDAALAGAHRHGSQSALLRDEAGRRWSFRVDVAQAGGDVGSFKGFAALTCIDVVSEPGPAAMRALSDLFGLSAAESRIAAWIAQGVSIEEVAARLSIRPGTVRNHLKAIFRKTAVTRQTQLSALLMRL